MQLQGIKNIIFDLGDVILNIDQKLTIIAFQKLLKNSFRGMERKLTTDNVLEKFETGEFSSDEFISFFKSFISQLTSKEIINAWNSMLLNIPDERWFLLNKLNQQYRLFLLSNTNEIHLKFINDYVAKHFNSKTISMPFEKAYFSHEMGLRKPNPEIFTTIIKDKNLIPTETLFIDDNEAHIISAKQLNLNTYHLISPETILDIFNNEH